MKNNLEAEIFYNQIRTIINNSTIPASLKYYIFKDLFGQIEREYNRILKQENMEIKQELQKQNQEVETKEEKE